MKPKIGCKGKFTTQSILEDLNFIIEHRFDGLEIEVKSEEDLKLSPKVAKQVREIVRKNKLFLVVHLPWSLPLSSPFGELARAVVKVVDRGIAFAGSLGADHIVIHSGSNEHSGGRKVPEYFETLIKNLKEIVRFGKKHKVKVGLENSNRYSGSIYVNPEDMLKIVSLVEGLKTVFDVGHSNTSGIDPVEFFRKAKDFVVNIHIHDNDGAFDQHAPIGKGNINFKALLKECKNSKYDGPFVLETFPAENTLKSKKILLNLWKQI